MTERKRKLNGRERRELADMIFRQIRIAADTDDRFRGGEDVIRHLREFANPLDAFETIKVIIYNYGRDLRRLGYVIDGEYNFYTQKKER
jgi:hypothetical protein